MIRGTAVNLNFIDYELHPDLVEETKVDLVRFS